MSIAIQSLLSINPYITKIGTQTILYMQNTSHILALVTKTSLLFTPTIEQELNIFLLEIQHNTFKVSSTNNTLIFIQDLTQQYYIELTIFEALGIDIVGKDSLKYFTKKVRLTIVGNGPRKIQYYYFYGPINKLFFISKQIYFQHRSNLPIWP